MDTSISFVVAGRQSGKSKLVELITLANALEAIVQRTRMVLYYWQLLERPMM